MRIRSDKTHSLFYPGKLMDDQERKFWIDYESRPELYRRIFELIVEVGDLGQRRWSINAAFEVARYRMWHHSGPVHDIYYLNNNHRAYAARLFHRRFPAYADMISIREQQR